MEIIAFDITTIMTFWDNEFPNHRFSLGEYLALEYHWRTELYDQSRCLCKRYKSGIAIPTSSSEYRDCSRNASNVRNYILSTSGLLHHEFSVALTHMVHRFEDWFTHKGRFLIMENHNG